MNSNDIIFAVILKVFENGFSDEYLIPKGMRIERGEGSTMKKFIACIVYLI